MNYKKKQFLSVIIFFSLYSFLFTEVNAAIKVKLSAKKLATIMFATVMAKKFQEFVRLKKEEASNRDLAQPLTKNHEETHQSINWYEYTKLNVHFFKEYFKMMYNYSVAAFLSPKISIKERTAFTLAVWGYVLAHSGFLIYDLATEE